jgi:hypothetical protein
MASKTEHDFLKIGYKAGVILSFVCIASAAVYMFAFLINSPDPESVRDELRLLSITAERRLLLLSTAMFIAMSFGFLGFALFLINAKGEVETEGSYRDYKFKFASVSPGLFVILCSTVIIIFAVTFRIDYGMTKGKAQPGTENYSTGRSSTDIQEDATDAELGLETTSDSVKKDSATRPDTIRQPK